ncbi:hypothetical protein FE697_008060 [Mumia zhuanghuii]|uniref:Uncharacterized protein n=2 Tax=Mumia TaxID=1546255 RepID=A0ABW1QL34_9ACTN|nr:MULTISPECIES: hypothetical protein [Mumia]KAA1423542.1 hypothetical protein FE697_008060 [Mumia zhuanghuii]
MVWTWRFETADGSAVSPQDDGGTFASRGDAESWVGEFYPDLADQGVDQVSLLEDGQVVFGPMSLHP